MIKKMLFALGATSLALGATACNTVKGVGQDIESVGETGEDVID